MPRPRPRPRPRRRSARRSDLADRPEPRYLAPDEPLRSPVPRLAWRYRSELAPLSAALALLATGLVLHTWWPGWWPIVAAVGLTAAQSWASSATGSAWAAPPKAATPAPRPQPRPSGWPPRPGGGRGRAGCCSPGPPAPSPAGCPGGGTAGAAPRSVSCARWNAGATTPPPPTPVAPASNGSRSTPPAANGPLGCCCPRARPSRMCSTGSPNSRAPWGCGRGRSGSRRTPPWPGG
jgi:hypothetical protein